MEYEKVTQSSSSSFVVDVVVKNLREQIEGKINAER